MSKIKANQIENLTGTLLTVSDIATKSVDIASKVSSSTLASSSGASLVGYNPAGTGAVATTVQSKLRDTPHLNDFSGVDNTGVSTSNTGLLSAIKKGSVAVSGNFTYRFNGFFTDTNDANGTPVRLIGDSILKTTTLSDPVIKIAHNYLNTSGHVFDGLAFTQPNDPAMNGGTANNHFCLSFNGVSESRVSNLRFFNPDLCIKFEYGSVGVPDVACYRNVVTNVVGYGVRGMGLQLFGSKYGSFTNLTFEGTDGSGGRALFHGLRLNGVGDGFFPSSNAKNLHNYVQMVAKKFGNGVALQQNSSYNTVHIFADDCTNGISVHGVAEAVSQVGLCIHNVFHLTATNCSYAVYDGGSSYNTFNVDADSCTTGGIYTVGDASWATTGRSIGNTYTGTVRNSAVTNLAEINGIRAKLDLSLIGASTATTSRGLLLNGSQCSGTVNISNCGVGARIVGNNNNLNVTVNSCLDSVVITGNNNVVNLNIDGNVTITGNNNIVTGVVGGTITNSGTGNDWSGVRGYSTSKRYFSQATDGTGFLVITHNLGKPNVPFVSILGTYNVSITTADDNSVTVRLYNPTGTVAASATGLVVDLVVRPRL